MTVINASQPSSVPSSVNVRSSVSSGKVAQPKPQAAPAATQPVTQPVTQHDVQKAKQDVQRAIEQATRQLESAGLSEKIGFGYVQELNLLYVQVKDAQSGEVIREIPSKDFIKHQLAMREMIGLLLDKTA